MNYSKKSILEKQQYLKSSKRKLATKISVVSFRVGIILFIMCLLIGTFAGFGVLRGLIDTAPNIDSINVIPSGYATTIYDSDGNMMHKLVGKNANRIYVTIDEIPEYVQDAFVAIEDARFYEHNGIDIRGIFRAAYSGLATFEFDQGASTITQQLLKNQVFDGRSEERRVGKEC